MPAVSDISPRHYAVYHRAAVDGLSQRAVADEYGISQPRVNQMVRRMEELLSHETPPTGRGTEGQDEMPRKERLYMLMRREKLRLENGYQQMMDAWRTSQQSSVTTKNSVVKLKGQEQGTKEETTTRNRDGNYQFYKQAMKFSADLLLLEGIGRNGAVDITCKGRLFEEPMPTEEVLRRSHEVILEAQAEIEADIAEESARQAAERATAALEASLEASQPTTLPDWAPNPLPSWTTTQPFKPDAPTKEPTSFRAPSPVPTVAPTSEVTLADLLSTFVITTHYPSEWGLSRSETSEVQKCDIPRENPGLSGVEEGSLALIAPAGGEGREARDEGIPEPLSLRERAAKKSPGEGRSSEQASLIAQPSSIAPQPGPLPESEEREEEAAALDAEFEAYLQSDVHRAFLAELALREAAEKGAAEMWKPDDGCKAVRYYRNDAGRLMYETRNGRHLEGPGVYEVTPSRFCWQEVV